MMPLCNSDLPELLPAATITLQTRRGRAIWQLAMIAATAYPIASSDIEPIVGSPLAHHNRELGAEFADNCLQASPAEAESPPHQNF